MGTRPRSVRTPPQKQGTADSPQLSHSGGRTASVGVGAAYPPELLPLLDGEHHTDELAVRFEVGWPVLEGWLVAAGGGRVSGADDDDWNGEGGEEGRDVDFGRVCIIYR